MLPALGIAALLVLQTQQTPPPDTTPIPLQANRIGLVNTKSLRETQKFVVPTAILYLSVDGVPRSTTMGARARTTVAYEYDVLALRKEFVEQLALAVQNELAAGLRTRQLTALVYDDISSDTSVVAAQRLRVDPEYGAPIEKRSAPRTTYAIVAPTPAQLFAGPELRKHQAFKSLAKQSNAIVLVPEFWFQAPHSLTDRPGWSSTRVSLSTGMDLIQASLTWITPSGATGSVTHLIAIPDLSNYVGSLDEVGSAAVQRNTYVMSDTSALWRVGVIGMQKPPKPTTTINDSEWYLVVSEPDYRSAVMRGARSFLKAALEILERERR